MTNFLHTKFCKITAITLIFAHIFAFGPIREAAASVSQSVNFSLDQALFNEGGNDRINPALVPTKLLLHVDGAQNSTVFTDSSVLEHTITAYGNAQIDTSQSKFSGASALFDGNGDYLSIADSDDWNFGSGDFTLDFWVRFNVVAAAYCISQKADNNNYWYVGWSNNILYLEHKIGGGFVTSLQSNWIPSINTWYHLAFVKNGNNWYVFINGVSQIFSFGVGPGDFSNVAGNLYIGTSDGTASFLNGWIDEFRLSKGIARWTENFTPPTEPYEPYDNAFPTLLDTIGEPIAQKSQSAAYILGGGFGYYIQSNPPELLEYIPNQNWKENESLNNAFDLDDYFRSFDNGSLTYSFSRVGQGQVVVSIDPQTNVVSFSQAQAYYGTEEIYFTAQDSEYNSTQSNVVSLTVQGVENAPVLDPIPEITVNENELITVTPHAVDLDGDEITYTFNAPLDAEGKWQTDYDDSGTYDVPIRATDTTGLYDEGLAHIVVRNVNRAPVLSTIQPVTANEGDIVTITPNATDADNDEITYYYAEPFDSQGKWITDYDDSGNYTVRVTAFDGIDSVYQDVPVAVNNVNRAPEITIDLSSYTVKPNENFEIRLTASDLDGDPMTFSLKKDGQEIASGNITNTYTIQTNFSNHGDHSIEAAVWDNQGLSDTDSTNVDVVDPNANNERINPVMGDFNGDALSDLGIHDSTTGTWEIAISDEGEFQAALDWLTNFGTTVDWYPIGGDFNGDGLTDIGIYNNTNGECQVALSTGSSFTVQGQWIDFADASYDWQIFMGNFNADKYTDVGFYNTKTGEWKISLSNGSSFAAPTTWLSSFGGTDWLSLNGDFNADGTTDICIFKKSTGEFKVAFSTTKAFVDTNKTWISGFAIDKGTVLSDFNADGLTDIGYWDKDTGDWHYAISTGNSFVDKGIWLDNFGTSSDESAYTGDFDGNGITDAAVFNREEIGINRWNVQLSVEQRTDLLVEIDNGIGGKTTIDYDYASKYDNDLLPFPVYVAKTITLIDTLPNVENPETYESYKQDFTYAGGYYDAQDREFRGFEKAIVLDPISGNYTETYFYQGKDGQDGALKGQMQKILAFDGNGKPISQTINTWLVKKAGPEESILGFPYVSEVNTTVWEENGSSVVTKNSFEYDGIGNIAKTTNFGDVLKQGDEKTSQASFDLAYLDGFNRTLQSILKDQLDVIIAQKDYEYDDRGNLLKETAWLNTDSQNSPSAQYTYDDFGNVLTTTNALSQTVTTTYESIFNAFPYSVHNELSHTITYQYDVRFGVVTSVTDTNNITTTTEYDNLGRIVNEKNPDGEIVTNYSYPDFNTKITTQLNLTKTEYVDGIGRSYKAVSNGEDGEARRNISAEKFFNNRGQLDYETLPHYVDEVLEQISYIRYSYDVRGRTKSVTNDFPGTLKDATSTVNYVSVLETEAIDPLGHKKGVVKDVYGNQIEVIEYTQGGVYHTYYEYDVQGNLIKVTDSKNNVIQITYDSLGYKLTMSDPDMGLWTYEYDAVGNLVQQTDSKAQVLKFEYDTINRLKNKIDYTNSSNPIALASYEYDYSDYFRTGRLSKVIYGEQGRTIDQSGSSEFFYDNLGREIKSIKTINTSEVAEGLLGGGVGYSVQREYDILDRLTSLTYPDGQVINYAYDTNSGLLERVYSVDSGLSTVDYAKDMTYNAQGQAKNIQFGNGTSTQYTYGIDLRLSRILTQNQTSSLIDLNYDFDKAGNLGTWTDNLRSNIKTFFYDDLNRLTEARKNGQIEFNYQYDSIGNITYKSDVGVMSYGVGAGPHAVTSAGGYSYRYDANGNMASGRNQTMEYDVENRLISVDNGLSTESYLYDGDGGRVRKGLSRNGTVPEQWTIYIGSLYEIATTENAEGTQITQKKHIFAGSNRIATVEQSDSETVKQYYYHSDHLGSSSVITDETGEQVQYCEYTPFGTISKNEGSDVTNYKFTGKELDNTGLYFYGARYYDPLLGRFITADSIVQSPGDPQTLNRYSYCRNNPLIYVDPSGHFFWAIAAIIIGAIIGGAMAAINGQPIWMGILSGAIAGIGAGFESLIGSILFGALAGAGNAALSGGDIGMGALFGAIGGGVGFGVGQYLGEAAKQANGGGLFWKGLAASTLSGGILSGISSVVAGGDFGEGFGMGAGTSAVSFMAGYAAGKHQQKVAAEKERITENMKSMLGLDDGYSEGGLSGRRLSADKIVLKSSPTVGGVLKEALTPIGKIAMAGFGDLSKASFPVARAVAKVGGATVAGIALGTDTAKLIHSIQTNVPFYTKIHGMALVISDLVSMSSSFLPIQFRPLRFTALGIHVWDTFTQDLFDRWYGNK